MEKDILENKKIAIIGAGHMGQAIIKGILRSKRIKKSNIFISNKSNNVFLVKKADYIFIAVKPFIVKEILKEIKSYINNKIILSVAAGVDIEIFEKILGKKQKIIRLMPNIPVSENEGVIGFFTNKNINSSEKYKVKDLISVLGKIIICKKEKDIDSLTLLTGCGPAISAYFINLISNSAARQGFSQSESIDMAIKIFEGTIKYLKNNNLTASELIKSVATKGGVTETILNSLIKNKVNELFEGAMEEGYLKINEFKNKI